MQYCTALIQYDLYMRMYSYLDRCWKVFNMEIREVTKSRMKQVEVLPVGERLKLFCLNNALLNRKRLCVYSPDEIRNIFK